MKVLFFSALRYRKPHAQLQPRFTLFLLGTFLLFGVLATGCKKDQNHEEIADTASTESRLLKSDGNVVNNYTGLPWQTSWELQQARAATAKYQNIRNALKDGYVNIGVEAEKMGHHFMKEILVDGNFDIRQPEILVYNKDHTGNFYLVAVEYAVPLNLPRPEGFTGTHDVWDDQSGFPLWLLHAWVWSYNPDGVFNPTNPLVHLHL